MAFYQLKKNKLWILKAVDRTSRRTVAWVTGGRDAATFQRLYDKVKHLTDCIFTPTIVRLSPTSCHAIAMSSASNIPS